MLSLIYVSLTLLAGAGMLGSLAYLLTLTLAAARAPRRLPAPADLRKLP